METLMMVYTIYLKRKTTAINKTSRNYRSSQKW